MRRSFPSVPLSCLLALPILGGCGPSPSTGFMKVTALDLVLEHPREDGPSGGSLALHAGEARRAWRTAPSQHASVELAATAGSRVEVSAARTAQASVRARVTLAVDGEPATVIVDAAIEHDGWTPIAIDLDPYAGHRVRLGLSLADETAGSAAIDWGEPILLERGDGTRPPDIVLITLDTTRADAVADPRIAPNLAALAERGYAFTNAWSAATSTTPSHASILTGLSVEQHGATTNRSVLGSEFETLAEQLARRGYQTAASVTVHHIGYEAGFGQGFGRFRPAAPGDSLDGAASIESVLQWLDEWAASGERPFFLWVHLFDPHTPYGPPRRFIEGELAERGFTFPPRRVEPATVPIFPGALPTPLAWLDGITNRAHVDALYRAGVAYADHLTGRLIDRIDSLGQREQTLFAVTADHGEALGEQGVFYQHAGLWPASLRVPLIVAGPGWASAGSSDARVGGIDIAPTLVAAAEGQTEATPLRVAADAVESERRVWFAETGLAQIGFRDADVHYAQALAAGQFGVLLAERADGPHVRAIQRYVAGTSWLFDVRFDPELEHDLAAGTGADVEIYRALIAERARTVPVNRHERTLGEEEAAALRALGYAEDPEPDRN